MLTGKVAVVTGGFGSLGRVVVHTVQAAGARVAALDRAAGPQGGAKTASMEIGEVDPTRSSCR